jgi:sirohydrochlorin ferrochelatase
VTRSALLLVDHGSRRAEANALLEALAELVRARAGVPVHTAHMELASPSIAEGFGDCVSAGAEEVVVVPCFLAPGRHASEDVPRLVAQAAARHPGARWRVAEVLGAHPLLAELVLVRAGLSG